MHIPVFGKSDIMMKQKWLREDETLEDLQLCGLKLIQKKKGFRFGMDSVLLAHFAQIGPKDCVADFGTGTGILPLLLIGRNKGKHFTCFEIQQEYAEMAARTMRMNGLEDRVDIICGDAAKALDMTEPCSLDAVICNPPYAVPGTALTSPFSSRSIARSQEKNTMEGFLKSAFRILKGRGRFITVYPAPRMLHIMRLMHEAHLEPKHFQLIYPQEDKPANLVLIEAMKDAKEMLHPMEPMIIYTRDHDLTNRLKSVYNIHEQNEV